MSNDKAIEKAAFKQEVSGIALGPKGFVLENMGHLISMLEVTLRSGLAPKGCATISDAIVRTHHGMSVGLDPLQALQSVYVVGGRPCLWGAAIPGLILASGKCKRWQVEIIGKDKDMCARVTTERTDVEGVNVFEFSMQDAILAGLPDKNATWKAYPKDHLRHKAVARAANEVYGDVIKGLAMKEDLDDAIDVEASVPANDVIAGKLESMAEELEKQAEPTGGDAIDVGHEEILDLFGADETKPRFVDQG